MNRNVYLFTTLLSIVASPLCHAMIKDLHKNLLIQQATILAKITAVENPRTALYLTENHVLIDGKNECSIIDIRTNKKIKKISDKYGCWVSHISVHPNQKKFAFSTHYPPKNDQLLTIYDAITYNAECVIQLDVASIHSAYFSPLNSTIATCTTDNHKVGLYNYETDAKTVINIKTGDPVRPSISFHPSKPLMYFAWQNLCSFDLETSDTIQLTTGGMGYHAVCECSPDGLLIARGTKEKIIITNLDTPSNTTLIDESYRYGHYITNIAIHPNSKVLITLSEPSQIFHYWNMDTAQLITMTQAYKYCLWSGPQSSLSISPSGTNLLVVINGECMEIEIPFEARYKDLTKETAIFAYLALQHYRHDNIDQLPKDIRHLLIATLLKASQY